MKKLEVDLNLRYVCMKSVNVFILPFIVESKLLWPLGMLHLIFRVQMY